MLVKFFKRGSTKDNNFSTGGNGAKDYLLGKDYADGIPSRDKAILLQGDPDAVTELINSLEFSKIYTSGCLAFDGIESQKITESDKLKLMNEFEQCLFSGLDRNQYCGYWVEHGDKIDPVTNTPRLELNFVFANVELTSGKSLSVYYDKVDQNRVNLWKDITNAEMGLSDPNAPQKKRSIRISQELPKTVKEFKSMINDHITELFKDENINNRDDVIAELKAQNYEITAIKPKSISIKSPLGGERPIRLDGAFYEQTFDTRTNLTKPTVTQGNDRKDDPSRSRETDPRSSYERVQKSKSEYEKLLRVRADKLSKRYPVRSDDRPRAQVQSDNQLTASDNRPVARIGDSESGDYTAVKRHSITPDEFVNRVRNIGNPNTGESSKPSTTAGREPSSEFRIERSGADNATIRLVRNDSPIIDNDNGNNVETKITQKPQAEPPKPPPPTARTTPDNRPTPFNTQSTKKTKDKEQDNYTFEPQDKDHDRQSANTDNQNYFNGFIKHFNDSTKQFFETVTDRAKQGYERLSSYAREFKDGRQQRSATIDNATGTATATNNDIKRINDTATKLISDTKQASDRAKRANRELDRTNQRAKPTTDYLHRVIAVKLSIADKERIEREQALRQEQQIKAEVQKPKPTETPTATTTQPKRSSFRP